MKSFLKKRAALGTLGAVGVLIVAFGLAWCHREEPVRPGVSAADPAAKRSRPKATSHRLAAVEAASASKQESDWTDPGSRAKLRVRKALRMSAEPTVEEHASTATATATIAIRVAEAAEFWNAQTQLWEAMPDEQFQRWATDVGDPQDVHATTASMVRQRKDDGQVVTLSRSAFGESDQQPNPDWNDTESGIHLALAWTGNRLKISWSSIECREQQQEVAIPFSEAFRLTSETGD